MSEQTTDGLTELLNGYAELGEDARDEMFRRVYFEVRSHAERMPPANAPQALRASGIVQDVYTKLFRNHAVELRRRHHFFSVAASAMRSVLVDHARAVRRRRPKDSARHSALDALLAECESRLDDRVVDLLEFDTALRALEDQDPRAFEVVQIRFFLGLSAKEIATVTESRQRTVERDLTFARAWLANCLFHEREDE